MTDELIDRLPRAAKLFMDNGAAGSIDEAIAVLRGYRMHVVIDEQQARSPTHQATLLTAIACGRRCMLGGVTVSGSLDGPLLVGVADGPSLRDAVCELGGVIVDACDDDAPLLIAGGERSPRANRIALRSTFEGWRGGVVPTGSPIRLAEGTEFPLAGALAGALGVAEIFAHLSGEIRAGRRAMGLSLWDTSPDADWRDDSSDGPALRDLPTDLWLIGLGHLGQAFLWAIALLPYLAPDQVRLFLQDVDHAGESTESTSVLTSAADRERLKTRISADWAEKRGFRTRMVERRFGTDTRVDESEPAIALCGVDNPDARRVLDDAGFAMVFEAGLGSGVEDYRLIRTHSFPNRRGSAQTWPSAASGARDVSNLLTRPAYENAGATGELDQCGLTRLAEVAVGAPFVGMTAATALLAQLLRTIAGGSRPVVANLDLRALEYRSVVTQDRSDPITFAIGQAKS